VGQTAVAGLALGDTLQTAALEAALARLHLQQAALAVVEVAVAIRQQFMMTRVLMMSVTAVVAAAAALASLGPAATEEQEIAMVTGQGALAVVRDRLEALDQMAIALPQIPPARQQTRVGTVAHMAAAAERADFFLGDQVDTLLLTAGMEGLAPSALSGALAVAIRRTPRTSN
jgi:hypothetical protein